MTRYPQGKISDDDLGETTVAVTIRKNRVIIAFSKPMDWIGMDKATALAIARKIIERAEELDDA